jgi:hypothetical protein
MTKKGPLSKAERFYITHHSENDIDDLCKDLDRAKSSVKKFLDTLPKKEKKDSLLYQQFGRNDKGSTVMTQSASEMADAKRPEFNQRKRPACVTTIRGK